MQSSGRQHTRWTIWAAFAALCLLVSSSRLLPVVAADSPSSIPQQSCFYGLAGLIALLIAGPRLWNRIKQRELLWLQLAGVSILLLGMPAVVSEWARDGVSDITQAALFTLVRSLWWWLRWGVSRELAKNSEYGAFSRPLWPVSEVFCSCFHSTFRCRCEQGLCGASFLQLSFWLALRVNGFISFSAGSR